MTHQKVAYMSGVRFVVLTASLVSLAAFGKDKTPPAAATKNEVAVSNPTAISINNAFGRPWVSNAPFGDNGYGTESVDDPDGRPFKGPPNPVAGGVFADTLTNRNAASVGTMGPTL